MADYSMPRVPGRFTSHYPNWLSGNFSGAEGHWNYPDYRQLLEQWMQPYMEQYNAALKALEAETAGSGQIASQRFRSGETSTMARLADQHTDAVRQITNSLADRGLLSSGDRSFYGQREDTRYTRAKYDASNQLIDYLRGLASAAAERRRQMLDALNQQRLATAGQLGDLFQPAWMQNPGYDVNNPVQFTWPGNGMLPPLPPDAFGRRGGV